MNLPGTPTILICAGGTGGHVFPALAVAQRLRASGARVLWLGTPHGMEHEVVRQAGIEFHAIPIRGLRGKGLLRVPVTALRALQALFSCLGLLRRVRPDAVLGMGGYVSGPAGLAAWLARRPLVVHEQNAIPGLTNRALRPLARRVLEAFPGSFGNDQVLCTGNPVRQDICDAPGPDSRAPRADPVLRLLVLGGSQGARALNETVPPAIAEIAAELQVDVCHQAGSSQLDAARAAYLAVDLPVQPVPFIHDMASRYGWADLVICRAGAMTVSELAAVGVASILVPFPFAVDDHQSANARHLADAGAAIVMPQSRLSSGALAALLRELGGSRQRLRDMARRARALARPHASADVARICLEVARA